MSRAGNFFSNKIDLNSFWYLKLDIFYSNLINFFYFFLINLKSFFFNRNITILNSCFKFYRGFLEIYLNLLLNYNIFFINYFNFKNINIILPFSLCIFIDILLINKKKYFLFFLIFLIFNYIYKLILIKNFNKLKLKNFNKLKLKNFNKLKLNLLINLIKIKFINKFNFNLLKLKIRNLNNKFLKFIIFKNNFLSKFKNFKNINFLISIFFYSIIFKNPILILNFIFSLFSPWIKNHFKMFKLLSIILNILFNKFNFFNFRSLTLKICGKIDGKMRKKKLFFSIGKNNFSRFDSKYSFLFLSKLTIFGSLGFKFYIIYD